VNTRDGRAVSLDCQPRVSRDPPAKAPPFPVVLQPKARETIYKSFGNALISTQPPEAHVVATGEFDIATTSTLTALFSQAVAAGCRDVRIDMSGVTFCDATTIGLLVSLDRRLRTAGGSLTIGRCSPSVLRLLHILGLDSLLSDHEDSHGRGTGVSPPARQFA
jgi:anti-sigma B factor antagonist